MTNATKLMLLALSCAVVVASMSGCGSGGSGEALAADQPQGSTPPPPPPPAASPAEAVPNGAAPLFFSDIDSGPNTGGKDGKGAFVTVWGKNFGTTQGSITVGGGAVGGIVSWTDTKVTFQLGANAKTGNIVVTNASGLPSNGLPFTVRSGQIFFVSPAGSGNGDFASPMSPLTAMRGISPGAIYYFRAGTYSGGYDAYSSWGRNFRIGKSASGTSASGKTAFVGYPGETAEIVAPAGQGSSNFLMSSDDGPVSNFTLANLRLRGESSNIEMGGSVLDKTTSASNVRVVGNVLSANYTGNTMSGLITVGNDGWRVLGNEIKDTGTTPPINNNHGIYVVTGASDIDVGWNYLHDLRMGHVIQVHTDGSAWTFSNVRIHHNVITAANVNDSRGINVGDTNTGTNGSIYDNVLYNLGQNFSGIAIYSGSWNIVNNTLYNVKASGGMVWVDSTYHRPTGVVIRNNIFYSDGNSPYLQLSGGTTTAQVTTSNNLYYNAGSAPSFDSAATVANPLFVNAAAGNFRLQSTSPAIDKGSATVSSIVTTDFDGISRTLNGAIDIGAFEQVK